MNMAWGVANFDTLTACVACSRCTQREHAYAEEAARVRVALLRELVANRESLVATHLSFPSVCRVAVDGDAFRWVPGPWEY